MCAACRLHDPGAQRWEIKRCFNTKNSFQQFVKSFNLTQAANINHESIWDASILHINSPHVGPINGNTCKIIVSKLLFVLFLEKIFEILYSFFTLAYVPSWTYTAVFQAATLGHPGVQDPVIGLKRSDSGAWFRDFEKDLGLVLCSLFEPFGTLCFQLTQK